MEEHGYRSEADFRKEFQKLFALAESGKIHWVVVDNLDRFGTKSKWQLIALIYRLQQSGCRLYDSDDKDWTSDDLLNLIQAGMAGDQSEKEVRKLSDRVLGGMRSRAKSGRWLGGRVPYGFDVVCLAIESGKPVERWRVQFHGLEVRVKIDRDGNTKNYDGKRNFPPTEKDEYLQLRPTTNERELEAIRLIFEWFLTESITPNAIANRLNELGYPAPRSAAKADQWTQKHVTYLISNTAIVGLPAWNQYTEGKYTTYRGGQHIKKNRDTREHVKQAAEDVIRPEEPIYPPIVEPEQFALAQKRLADLPHKKTHAPRNPMLWLAGLLHCGNCGGLMHGVMMKLWGGRCGGSYICGKANVGANKDCTCKKWRVRQDAVEQALHDYFGDTSPLLRDIVTIVSEAKSAKNEKWWLETVEKMRDAINEIQFRVASRRFPADPESVMNDPEDMTNGDLALWIDAYQHIYDGDKQRLTARHDQIETEHSRLTLAWSELPTTRAKEKTKARLEELEEELERIERRLKNAADDYATAKQNLDAKWKEWTAAQGALESQIGYRQKTDAIRRVVEKIVVTFEPTGRKWPLATVKSIEIVPREIGYSEDVTSCVSVYRRKSKATNTVLA